MVLKIIIFFMFIFSFSCDKQSNPYMPSLSNSYQNNIFMNGNARDFIIQKNVNAENFSSNSFGFETSIMIPCGNETDISDCNDRFWCFWDEEEDSCVPSEKDLLIVANEFDGLLIYEINDLMEFSLIYSNNGFEYTDDPEENILDLELRSIEYSQSNFTLYALDKFEFIYQIFIPGILVDNQYKESCNDGTQEPIHSLDVGGLGTYHATKFALKESNGLIDGLYILNKHNANNELYLEESYSEIQFESYVLDQPSGTSCLPFSEGAPITETSSILSEEDGLGYGVSDIAFDGNSFVVANPSDEYYSLKIYDLIGMSSLSENSEIMAEEKVTSTRLINNYLHACVKGFGCYITLLPAPGNLDEIDNILNIPENFSVYDIHYEEFDGSEYLLLSCGSNGVLIYEDNGIDGYFSEENFKGHIVSSYAYVAKMFNGDTVFVGTKNGVEIYNIGE